MRELFNQQKNYKKYCLHSKRKSIQVKTSLTGRVVDVLFRNVPTFLPNQNKL